jgi:protein TonB
MRKVYLPSKGVGSGNFVVLAGAVVLTLGVFFLVPLTQMISTGNQKRLMAAPDSVALPPPPPVADQPPPPPPEQQQEQPPPQLADAAPPPLSLSALDLDLGAAGSGGVLPMAGFVEAAKESMTGVNVFDVSELDKPPTLVASVSPNYPNDLRKKRVEGSVTLVFLLDETGRIEDARVENSSHPGFEQPALDALRKWRFKPGTKEGTPVKTHMRLPMNFKIAS